MSGIRIREGAGLYGLALLLAACASEPEPPAPATPDEQQAIAEAEEMIETGRPIDTTEADTRDKE